MGPDTSSNDEIRRFEEQYRSQPESLVFARLADAYRKAGQSRRALAVLTDGLTRHPDYPSGHIVLARTLRDLGRLDEAASAFQRVLELDGNNLVAVRELEELGVPADGNAPEGSTASGASGTDPESGLEPGPGEVSAGEERPDAWWDKEPAPAADPGPTGPPAEEDRPDAWWEDEPAPPADPVEAHGDVDRPAHPSEEPARAPDPGHDEDGDGRRPEDEVVDAILNGEVPQTIRAEDTWWYEEQTREEPVEPSKDADLLTRTMADLYAQQGLHDEAAEIYEELLRDSPEDEELKRRLAELSELALNGHGGDEPEGPMEESGDAVGSWEAVPSPVATPGFDGAPDATPATSGGDGRVLDDLSSADEMIPEPLGPATGVPVAEELRRILRLGEERAAVLPDPDDGGARGPLDDGSTSLQSPESATPTSDEAPPGNPAEQPGQSGFSRDWLGDLGEEA
jgi:tetratricopeptide (TPR) repeat protein